MLFTALAIGNAMGNAAEFSAEQLEEVAKNAAAAAVVRFRESGVKPADLEVSIAALDRPSRTFAMGSFQGDTNIYPASVVKLIYAARLASMLDKKELRLTAELDRAVKDMLVESSNDGTALVLDTITGTTGGPELPSRELKIWMEKRQSVNRWLKSLGYANQNACQKPWNEGPYGRERQGYGENFALRNMLSPNACARMMAEVALAKVASPERCKWLLGYMKRATGPNGDDPGSQSKGFIGGGLPASYERYSKAGWAYQVRHDVCYFKVPGGGEFVLAIFTDRHGGNPELLPFLTAEVRKGLRLPE